MTTETKEHEQVTQTFAVKGMTCASCVRHVEGALLKVEGVETADVNLATERVTISIQPDVTLRELRSSVEASGYELTREIDAAAQLEDTEAAERAEEERSLRIRMIFALTLGGILIVLSQSSRIPLLDEVRLGAINIISWILATPVLFWAGLRFY
ncbi:MAG: cation-translocating P-type ATPase, partial [Chloroflexi bacterium]|nr:cation-translocating P-type ATPase [Chloroflexota bacterium]